MKPLPPPCSKNPRCVRDDRHEGECLRTRDLPRALLRWLKGLVT